MSPCRAKPSRAAVPSAGSAGGTAATLVLIEPMRFPFHDFRIDEQLAQQVMLEPLPCQPVPMLVLPLLQRQRSLPASGELVFDLIAAFDQIGFLHSSAGDLEAHDRLLSPRAHRFAAPVLPAVPAVRELFFQLLDSAALSRNVLVDAGQLRTLALRLPPQHRRAPLQQHEESSCI